MRTVQVINKHVKNTIPLAALSFRKPRNSMQLADVNFKILQKPCGLQVILTSNVLQTPCRCAIFASVCCTYCANDRLWFRACRKHSTVRRIFASELNKITTQFLGLIPHLANIMQFADVGFARQRKYWATAKFRAMN